MKIKDIYSVEWPTEKLPNIGQRLPIHDSQGQRVAQFVVESIDRFTVSGPVINTYGHKRNGKGKG